MSAVYGCHNREPLRDRVKAQDGWREMPLCSSTLRTTRVPEMIDMVDPMSKDCKYTHSEQGLKDAKCEGCKHRALPVSAS